MLWVGPAQQQDTCASSCICVGDRIMRSLVVPVGTHQCFSLMCYKYHREGASQRALLLDTLVRWSVAVSYACRLQCSADPQHAAAHRPCTAHGQQLSQQPRGQVGCCQHMLACASVVHAAFTRAWICNSLLTCVQVEHGLRMLVVLELFLIVSGDDAVVIVGGRCGIVCSCVVAGQCWPLTGLACCLGAACLQGWAARHTPLL
jgi:hypothetical protein